MASIFTDCCSLEEVQINVEKKQQSVLNELYGSIEEFDAAKEDQIKLIIDHFKGPKALANYIGMSAVRHRSKMLESLIKNEEKRRKHRKFAKKIILRFRGLFIKHLHGRIRKSKHARRL